MSKLFATLIAGMSLAACSSPTQQQDKVNMETVAGYIKAVESKDFGAMEKYLDEKYMGLGPSYGDTIYKPQALANWQENINNLYESIHYSRLKLAPVTITEGEDVKGEWVGSWAELQITYKTGEKVTIWSNTDYLIKSGKIVRSLTLYNEADALRQLGYQFIPPN